MHSDKLTLPLKGFGFCSMPKLLHGTMYSISNAFKICDGFNLHDFIMENKHITLV